MIADKMKNMVANSSAIRAMFEEGNRLAGIYGAENVFDFSLGNPNVPAPEAVKNAIIEIVSEEDPIVLHGYTNSNCGYADVREAVADSLNKRFDTHFEGKNIVMTVGAAGGLNVILKALINPGDEVIVLSPGYVAYEPCVRLAGGVPVIVELKEEDKFKLKKEQLKQALSPKTKAILMNFPGNPTGGIMTKEDFSEIVPLIQESGIAVVTDEIYAELTYSGKHCSIASFNEIKDQVILISGFSKAYSMTGWRLGYIAAHRDLIAAMNKVHQYAIMCAPTISQYAGIEAMAKGDGDVEMMKDSFERRRNFIVNGLNRMGLQCPMPQGAFYVFPSIKHTGMTSEEFCEKLLEKEKVAVVPGNAFGASGEGFVRISYAYSIDEIKGALKRIAHFLETC